MRLYLFAIVKLVQREAESDALRRFLRRHRGDERVTSALARVEVVRALLPGGTEAVAHARRHLTRLHQMTVTSTYSTKRRLSRRARSYELSTRCTSCRRNCSAVTSVRL